MHLLATTLHSAVADHDAKTIARTERTREAAVAAVFRGGSGGEDPVEVLLMKRRHQPGDPWSGHMSFPGGRRESYDADLVATAVRETREEVGVDLSTNARLVGRLDEVQAIGSGRPLDLVIAPYVYVLTGEVSATTSDEAEKVLWAPVGPMLHGETREVLPYEYRGRWIDMPGYRVGEDIVWGLTHRMLESLFALVR